MGKKLDEDEATAARDFTLARLAACRGSIATASNALDEALMEFNDPSDDPKGKTRKDLLDAVDAAIAEAARSIQLASQSIADIDPRETEPEDDEEDDDDEDEDDEDEDED